MPKLLITGGAGFIGANFVHFWLGEHPKDRVVVLDALTYAGNLASLGPVLDRAELRFVHGDIREQALVETLLRDERIDTIVHFAAESHVDRSIRGPDVFLDVNVDGTHTLLKAARRIWIEGPERPVKHRFHHVSTDEVYGSLGEEDPAFSETTPYAPNSPYAASKAAADHLVRAYHKTYGLEITISNCSNNYGPFHHPEKLIPLCLLNLLNGEDLPIYGDGSNIRDWLYVEDHCRGIEQILAGGRTGETYNLGGNCERRNLELVRLLCRLLDEEFARRPELADAYPRARPAKDGPSEELITFVRDRPGHDERYAIDMSKARQELGVEPRTSLEEGLTRTVRWYLDHPKWWRDILDGSYRQWVEEHYGPEKSTRSDPA